MITQRPPQRIPPLGLGYQYSVHRFQHAQAGWEQGPGCHDQLRGSGDGEIRMGIESGHSFPRGRRHLSAEFRRLTWYNQLGPAYNLKTQSLPKRYEDPRCRDSVSRFSLRQQNALPPKYLGIWITLSWKQSRPRRLRKNFLPLAS